MYNLYQEIPNFPIGQTGLEDPGLEDLAPEDTQSFCNFQNLKFLTFSLKQILEELVEFFYPSTDCSSENMENLDR